MREGASALIAGPALSVETGRAGPAGIRVHRRPQDLETIKIQNEIERLDREWQMQRESLCRRGKDGQLQEPTVAASVVGSVVFAIFGVIWMVTASSASSFGGRNGIFAISSLIGVGIIVVSVFGLFRGIEKSREFGQSKVAYESRRRQLIADLGRRNGND